MKSYIVERLAKKGVVKTSADAVAVHDAVMEIVNDLLLEGHAVRLGAVGTLKVTKTTARVGRNPKTGDPVDIPAGHKVGFKASQTIKRLLKD